MIKHLIVGASIALAPAHAPTHAHIREYVRAYDAVRHEFGRRAPGRQILRQGTSNGKRATDREVVKSIHVLDRMLHPAAVVRTPPMTALVNQTPPQIVNSGYQAAYTSSLPSPPPSGGSSGGYGSVPGVPSSFASCVALRESTNGAGSSNIYGILPSNGYYPGMSISAQKQLFSHMYAGGSGVDNWRPYDGC